MIEEQTDRAHEEVEEARVGATATKNTFHMHIHTYIHMYKCK